MNVTIHLSSPPFYSFYSALVFTKRAQRIFLVERDDPFDRRTLRHVSAGGNYSGPLVADTYRVSKYCCHQQTRAARIRERALLIRYRALRCRNIAGPRCI